MTATSDIAALLGLCVIALALLCVTAVVIFGHELVNRFTSPKARTRYRDDKEHVKDWKLRQKWPAAFDGPTLIVSGILNAKFPAATAPRPRGRLPQRPPDQRLALKWAHEYLKAPLPAPSYPIDVTEGITDWGIYGNAQFGNCYAAAELHLEMTTAEAASTPQPPASTTTLRTTVAIERSVEYTRTPNPPGPGAVLATYLLWLYKRGLIKAFAPVDCSALVSSDAFMSAGFGLYVGVNLTPTAEHDFESGIPWSGTHPDPTDGHCVLRVKATGPGLSDRCTYVTWGAPQEAVRCWTQACVLECWLVVTTEEQAALFTPQLMADVAALGGTG